MLKNYHDTIRQLSLDARLLLLTVIVVGFSYLGVYVTLFNLYLLRLGYGPVFIGHSTVDHFQSLFSPDHWLSICPARVSIRLRACLNAV